MVIEGGAAGPQPESDPSCKAPVAGLVLMILGLSVPALRSEKQTYSLLSAVALLAYDPGKIPEYRRVNTSWLSVTFSTQSMPEASKARV